jgi:hypothetical protein
MKNITVEPFCDCYILVQIFSKSTGGKVKTTIDTNEIQKIIREYFETYIPIS